MELGLGLRAAAQSYNYSYNKMKLGTTCQMNLKSLGITSSWCLDGCAEWRKAAITVTIKLKWELSFK